MVGAYGMCNILMSTWAFSLRALSVHIHVGVGFQHCSFILLWAMREPLISGTSDKYDSRVFFFAHISKGNLESNYKLTCASYFP